MSSTVEIEYLTCLIAVFACLMSTQIRTSPSFFGTATIGDTQGVGCDSNTFSITSSCSSISI